MPFVPGMAFAAIDLWPAIARSGSGECLEYFMPVRLYTPGLWHVMWPGLVAISFAPQRWVSIDSNAEILARHRKETFTGDSEMTRYDSMSCLVDPVPHANMTRLTHLHQLLPRIEGMDFELACHWPDLCIVQELPQVAFVVVGHPNLLHQTILNATKYHLFRQLKKEASEKLEAACLNFLSRFSL